MSMLDRVTAWRSLIRAASHVPTMAEQCALAQKGEHHEAIAIQAALILEKRRKVLTYSQTKLDKATGKTAFVNRGLTLSPADEARGYCGPFFNACKGATAACRLACVGARTGQGKLTSSKVARIGRTVALHLAPEEFHALYDAEVRAEETRAAKRGARLALRVNVAADLAWLAGRSKAEHPGVEHYDYTAISANMRLTDGVHRVYSLKDGPKRLDLALGHLAAGRGVAVVFAASARKKEPLPATWNGAPVIDGDLHDLWFLQRPPVGPFVVGLRVKGDTAQVAACIASGFAQPVA